MITFRGKATVRRTLGVVCDLCVMFIYFCLVHDIGDLRVVFILTFILSCNYLTVKKMRKLKVLRYYKGAGPHRQINPGPDLK